MRASDARIEEIEGSLVFGGEVVGGLRGEVDHFAVGDDGGVVAREEMFGLPDVAVVGIPGHIEFASAVEAFVFEEQDGIIVLVSGEEGVEGVLRCAGVERFQAGNGEKERVEFLRVKRTEGEAAAGREAQHERNGGAGAEVVGGRVLRDLGGGFGGEVGELKFLDRTVAVEGEADCVTGAGAFRERRIENAGTAEILEEAFGDLEGTAVGADVLAKHDGLGPLAQDLAMGKADGLRHRDVLRCGGLGFPREGR